MSYVTNVFSVSIFLKKTNTITISIDFFFLSNFRDSWKNTKKKMVLLNYTYARAICVLSALSAIVATATLIVGFVNMGTYKVAEAESCVGVWCGFVVRITPSIWYLMNKTELH